MKLIRSSVHSHFQMDLNQNQLITSRLPLREIKLLCSRYNSVLLSICTIFRNRLRSHGSLLLWNVKSLHWDQMLSCDLIWPIKCSAPLTSRQESKCALTGLLHWFFLALIAMFKRQNWNQSVFWQVQALSFSNSYQSIWSSELFKICFTGHEDHQFWKWYRTSGTYIAFVRGPTSFAWVVICAMKIVID